MQPTITITSNHLYPQLNESFPCPCSCRSEPWCRSPTKYSKTGDTKWVIVNRSQGHSDYIGHIDMVIVTYLVILVASPGDAWMPAVVRSKKRKREKRRTTLQIPTWSPTVVLTQPEPAWLRWADGKRYYQIGLIVLATSRPIKHYNVVPYISTCGVLLPKCQNINFEIRKCNRRDPDATNNRIASNTKHIEIEKHRHTHRIHTQISIST